MTSAALTVHIRGIGLKGPGLDDWRSGRTPLAGTSPWHATPTPMPTPQRLPPAERRRAGTIVKLSIAVADEACAQTDIDLTSLATVFSASTGDTNNCHALCEALADAERVVSPTRFTNSVHNAAAGYWHIAIGSHAPSTSLCAFDGSFGAGMVEAVAQCVAMTRPVLLVAVDVPYPEPLLGMRPVAEAFGVALLLAPGPGAGDAGRFTLEIVPGRALSTCDHPGLEAMRRTLPAARALPLLQALARRGPRSIVLDYLDDVALALHVEPGGPA